MTKRVGFLGVPMDLGGGRRGVDMGPSAIRIAGLGKKIQELGHEFEDLGNVPVLRSDTKEPKDQKAKYLDSIANCCRRLKGRVERLVVEKEGRVSVEWRIALRPGATSGQRFVLKAR